MICVQLSHLPSLQLPKLLYGTLTTVTEQALAGQIYHHRHLRLLLCFSKLSLEYDHALFKAHRRIYIYICTTFTPQIKG